MYGKCKWYAVDNTLDIALYDPISETWEIIDTWYAKTPEDILKFSQLDGHFVGLLQSRNGTTWCDVTSASYEDGKPVCDEYGQPTVGGTHFLDHLELTEDPTYDNWEKCMGKVLKNE